MFKLEIETGNAAFQDGLGDLEIARILKEVTNRVLQGFTEGTVRDMNGNTVGKFSMPDMVKTGEF